MKKIIVLTMVLLLLFSLTACGTTTETDASLISEEANTTEAAAQSQSTQETMTEEEKPASIKITALNGDRAETEVEVPYDPQRIAVLDMPSLDILDSLGLGERIVGSAAVSIEYLTDYNPDDTNGRVMNLGTVKTADLEKVAACEPDVIFIGGRLSSVYNDLSAIAPVVYLSVDYEKGVVQSTADNAGIIASMFGMEDEIDASMEGFQERIDALKTVLEGKNVLLSMYNSNALGLMDTESQLNILAKELGANNLGETVGEVEKATHGEEASWETVITLNPEYMFVLDRSTATGAADEEVLGAREVIENDLIKELNVYKEGKIVYFIEHANVWYTSTGGIQALDTMLSDLEAALLKE